MAEMSEARKRANKKWNDANMTTRYDRLNILVPKGRKSEIQDYANAVDGSLNKFVNRAIEETMERDKHEGDL